MTWGCKRSPVESRTSRWKSASTSESPTYSGGLGVLAGDTLHAAADLRVPMVGVTLLYRKGYFTQRLDGWGHQRELPASWEPTALLTPLAVTTEVEIEGRPVKLRAWLYRVTGGR